jgi:hypothetical protein
MGTHHSAIPSFHHSIIPSFRHSIIPPFHHSAIPSFHHSIIPPSVSNLRGLARRHARTSRPYRLRDPVRIPSRATRGGEVLLPAVSSPADKREASPSAPSGGSVRENAVVRSCRASPPPNPCAAPAARANKGVPWRSRDSAQDRPFDVTQDRPFDKLKTGSARARVSLNSQLAASEHGSMLLWTRDGMWVRRREWSLIS